MLVALFVVLWVLGSLFDNVTTYIGVHVLGFAEANRVQAYVVYNTPIYVWFAIDAAAMLFVYGVYRLVYRLNGPLSRIFLMVCAAVRIVPVIRNILVLLLYC